MRVWLLLCAGCSLWTSAAVNWADSLQNLCISISSTLENNYTYKTSATADADFSDHGLLVSESQITPNPNASVYGSVGGLVDGNVSTYLQLTYLNDSTNVGYHYLDLDLGSAQQMFDLKYARRNFSNAKAVPYVVRIYSSDNPGDGWKAEGDRRFSYTIPMTSGTSTYADYIGLCRVVLAAPHRWVRIEVLSTLGNLKSHKYPYFYLSELGVYPCSRETPDFSAYNEASADVRSRFEAQLSASYSLLVQNKSAVTADSVAALSEAWTAMQRAMNAAQSNKAGRLVINEIQQGNIDTYVDPSYNYGGWIEFYNPTSGTIHLGGCYLTDRLDSLRRFQIPEDQSDVAAHGFKVMWFDHHSSQAPSQVSFKLDAEGGTLYLVGPNGDVLISQSYPQSIARASYARLMDGGDEWNYTATPTPGASNEESESFSSLRLDAPEVNLPGQLFTGTLSVSVGIPQGCTLRYTTDGTAPTTENGQPSSDGNFLVARTSIYRFRLFRNGYLPSKVVTRSYIQTANSYGTPVVSIVTDSRNLYDDSLGIMVRGVNGITGNGQTSKCNWNQDWDRPVNMEYLDADGNCVLNQEAEIAIGGGWSRASTPRPFKVKADAVFEGEKFFPYALWTDKPSIKAKTMWLRNGGNSVSNRIHDMAVQAIVASSGIDVDWQAGRPVVHYLNGEYSGVLNLREATNKDYVYQNYGYGKDEIDQFEYSGRAYHLKQGTSDALNRLVELSKKAADDAVYAEIRNLLDIDEFVNYMAIEGYGANWDWPHNNVKAWRPRMEGGRFRFVLFDTDGCFDRSAAWRYEDEDDSVTLPLFYNLLKNDSFRKQFADAFCLVGGSVFEPTRSATIIDSIATRSVQPLSFDNISPWSRASSLKNKITTSWYNSMMTLLQRNITPKLDSTQMATLQLSQDVEQGTLYLNTQKVPTGRFSGQVYLPATLRAEAPAGYSFKGWSTLAETQLFARKSAWFYYDQGSLDGVAWQTGSGTFSEGKAPLGYDSRGTSFGTTMDYGISSSNKRPTYYMRKSVVLSSTPSPADVFTLNFSYDDGIIVYVNGSEAARVNMPSGSVSYSTYASSNASGNPASGSLQLSASLFKKGQNRIAVELHNSKGTSSDVYWDASLTHTGPGGTVVSTEPTYSLEAGKTYGLIATYEKASDDDETAQVPPVRINEVSAGNSIYVNEYFKRNDWIELYNTTSAPVDVKGMYLTDNLSKPKKYAIQGGDSINTVIPAHGYLIVWADKLDPLTSLHAGFKLANEDAAVMLTSQDGTWSDTLAYSEHRGDETVGRYPDGSNLVYRMSIPTFAATNRLTSYGILLTDTTSSGGTVGVETVSASEGLQLAYSNGRLVVNGAGNQLLLCMYDTAGALVMQKRLNAGASSAVVAVDTLQPGVYVTRVSDEKGRHAVLKISVMR